MKRIYAWIRKYKLHTEKPLVASLFWEATVLSYHSLSWSMLANWKKRFIQNAKFSGGLTILLSREIILYEIFVQKNVNYHRAKWQMNTLTSCLCSWIAEITDPGREQNHFSPYPPQSSMALVDEEEQHFFIIMMKFLSLCLGRSHAFNLMKFISATCVMLLVLLVPIHFSWLQVTSWMQMSQKVLG